LRGYCAVNSGDYTKLGWLRKQKINGNS
jgi:hypothetical protein